MCNKWCKYVLMSAVVLCGITAGSMKQGVFAQEVEQPKGIAEGEKEDLQWQLKQMEESMQRQQEQIQTLESRIGEAGKGVSTGGDALSATKYKELDKIVETLKGLKIGGLWYLSYQNGVTGNTSGGDSFNAINIKRGYLTVEKEFFSWFQARITTDVTTVKDPTSNLDGSLSLRIKYLYGKFTAPDMAFLTKPNVEVGVTHMPLLDFEENLNYYRLQDTMFTERNGLFNSADTGVMFTTLLGGTVDENYQQEVNAAYPGRYGSIQAGIFNGGGYAASEKNSNKVLEGRVTIRPLPDIIPGLQFTYFGLTGKGNTDEEPDWIVNLPFVSYEHKYFALTAQYYWGTGNQQGTDENDKRGYSFFTELKPHKKFSVIGRFDHFDPDKNASNDENNRYIAGIAYHIDKQHRNMVLLDYDTVQYEELGKSNDKRVQLTLQVAF